LLLTRAQSRSGARLEDDTDAARSIAHERVEDQPRLPSRAEAVRHQFLGDSARCPEGVRVAQGRTAGSRHQDDVSVFRRRLDLLFKAAADDFVSSPSGT
jgi:hypothetical protein